MPLYLTIYDRSEAEPTGKVYKNNMIKLKFNEINQLIQSHVNYKQRKA